jgi:cell division GTPase FtsZ
MNRQLHIIGLGGAGCNAVEHIYGKGVPARYTCISYPQRSSIPKDINFLTIASVSNRDLFDAYDLVGKNHRYILLAGLGGKTGSYLVEELVNMLCYQRREFLAVCSMPFAFEGCQRRSVAESVRSKYQSMSNFIFFDLNSLVRIWGDITLSDAFDKADERFYWLSLFQNYN